MSNFINVCNLLLSLTLAGDTYTSLGEFDEAESEDAGRKGTCFYPLTDWHPCLNPVAGRSTCRLGESVNENPTFQMVQQCPPLSRGAQLKYQVRPFSEAIHVITSRVLSICYPKQHEHRGGHPGCKSVRLAFPHQCSSLVAKRARQMLTFSSKP